MPAKSTSATVTLPEVFAVGFTGHRHLHDEAACRARIEAFLAEHVRASARTLYAVSSVAAGGDLIFAESCLQRGIPLRVLLPLPREDFRADFDAATWQRVEAVLAAAVSVEVTGGYTASAPSRAELYYNCGLEVVQQSQLLLALWDGAPSRGLGGTADVVAFARAMLRPVLWLHAETGVLVPLHEMREVEMRDAGGGGAGDPDADSLETAAPLFPAADPELLFLNALPGGDAAAPSASAHALVTAWLAKLDAAAMRVAPQVRHLAAVPIVLTALAAFVSASAPRLHAMQTWLTVGGGLGVAAGLLPFVLGLSRRQAEWVRVRTAAEVSRSVLALWPTPGRYRVLGPESLPELAAMLRSLDLLKAQAGCDAPSSLDAFRDHYLRERVIDQKDYFLRQSRKADDKARRYRLLGRASSAAGVLLATWTLATGLLLHHERGAWWLPLVASAFFQVATVTAALVVVHDCDRRRRRYLELHLALGGWERELRAMRTWPPVLQVVERVERALFVELLEWRSLLQNTKMPRH